MKQSATRLRKLLGDSADIIIFGSTAKGGIAPRDLDIVILSDKDPDQIKKKIKIEFERADVHSIGIKDYMNPLWLTLIREGFSVRHMKYLHEIYRIKPIVLYKYSLRALSASKKVMFERAIKRLPVERLSNRVVMVPVDNSQQFSDFLRQWNIDIDASEYFLMPLLRKEI